MEEDKIEDPGHGATMAFVATCVHCGRQLGKYESPCRRHITTCPKCGAELAISVNKSKMLIDLLALKSTRATA